MDMQNQVETVKYENDVNFEQYGYDLAKVQELNVPSANYRAAFSEVKDITDPTTGVTVPGSQPNSMIQPYTYDIKLAEEKGLAQTGQFSEKYFILQALYRSAFESEVLSNYNTEKYDKAITESAFVFTPTDTSRQNFYQKYSTLDSDYIYLRNNIHIERLSLEELATLESYLAPDSKVSIAQVNSLVADTYSWVLRVYPTNEYNMVGFIAGDVIPNVSIVLEITYGSADDSQGKPYEFIDEQIVNMQEEFSTDEMPVVVFR